MVLGRPGSGCSTLLKTLANQRQEYHAVHGEVWYDSLKPEEVERRYRGDVQYCPEDDVHFPTLTVDQTLRFAAETRTPQTRIDNHTREEHVTQITQVLETVFGLRHVKDTLVGDASVRGVSGGEKKRVSIAEALATRSRLNSWDNSTRGLEYVRLLSNRYNSLNPHFSVRRRPSSSCRLCALPPTLAVSRLSLRSTRLASSSTRSSTRSA